MEDIDDASPVQLVGEQPEHPSGPSNPVPAVAVPPKPVTNGVSMDVEMKEEPSGAAAEHQPNVVASAPSPQPPPAMPSQPTIPPPAAPTPARSSPHPSQTSAAASAHPAQPTPHGSPTRIYLNQNVTPYLLEGMKLLATQEPERPLRFLADFLAAKSREVEGQ